MFWIRPIPSGGTWEQSLRVDMIDRAESFLDDPVPLINFCLEKMFERRRHRSLLPTGVMLSSAKRLIKAGSLSAFFRTVTSASTIGFSVLRGCVHSVPGGEVEPRHSCFRRGWHVRQGRHTFPNSDRVAGMPDRMYGAPGCYTTCHD